MKTTMTLANEWKLTPFEIFNKDTDEVIMTINYYIALGDTQTETVEATQSGTQYSNNKEVRIRVNDKTATGGWF